MICKIINCNKKVYSRGWCRAHYSRWLHNGNPLGGNASPNQQKCCSVAGCNKPFMAKGRCASHYNRWRIYGDNDQRSNGKLRDEINNRSKHPLYSVYRGMMMRCYNKKVINYYCYGGRGIEVCERWRDDFWAFVEDISPRPSSKHTIERIDNNHAYQPGNCRWATRMEQNRNQRSNNFITAFGKTQISVDWAKETGLSRRTINRRLKLGWSADDALKQSGQKR